MAKVYGIYFVLGIATWLRDEAVSHDFGQRIWHLVDFWPSWSATTWIIIALSILLLSALEGSYRHAKTIDQAHSAAITNKNTEVTTLKQDLTAARLELANRAPNVIITFQAMAQFGGFTIENTGESDATNVKVGNLVNGKRFLSWKRIDRIKSKCHEYAQIRQLEIGDSGEQASVDDPLSPDKNRHVSGLHWLSSATDEPAMALRSYATEVLFSSDDGGTEYHSGFQVDYAPAVHEVYVLPKPPKRQIVPRVPQSLESTTHES